MVSGSAPVNYRKSVANNPGLQIECTSLRLRVVAVCAEQGKPGPPTGTEAVSQVEFLAKFQKLGASMQAGPRTIREIKARGYGCERQDAESLILELRSYNRNQMNRLSDTKDLPVNIRNIEIIREKKIALMPLPLRDVADRSLPRLQQYDGGDVFNTRTEYIVLSQTSSTSTRRRRRSLLHVI